MSLINDALKKAARQRAEEQGEYLPPMPGGSRVSRAGQPMRKQTLVLIGAAAVALVVVSAVITGILMTGKPEPKAAAVAKAQPEAPPPLSAPKVIVQAPVVAVSLPQAAPVAAAPALPPRPSPTPVASPVPTAVAIVAVPPVASGPAPATPAASQSHNDAVQAVVDGFHISGVRTAGAGSKALIDGHIYRLKDVVDKTFGLKLVKVDEDHLTFLDRDGNTFIKSF